MAEINERCTLVRAFAEFELLPDLLARTSVPGPRESPDRSVAGYAAPRRIDEAVALETWTEFLAGAGANMDHAETEDLPLDGSTEGYLAEDAWRLAKRLGWVTPRGLGPAGRRLANIAERPLMRRTRADLMTLLDTVAGSVQDGYVGGEGLEVVPLLQQGARRLAETDHIWASYVPGLLLVEFEALIYWSFARPAQAVRLCENLVAYRDTAMHRYDTPSPDVDPDDNLLLHADATARLYLETEELGGRTNLSLTEVRATSMLLTFAGLLEEHALGPVNYLLAPSAGR